jgi:hypothetical protein
MACVAKSCGGEGSPSHGGTALRPPSGESATGDVESSQEDTMPALCRAPAVCRPAVDAPTLLDRFADHLAARGERRARRTMLLDAARRFLQWPDGAEGAAAIEEGRLGEQALWDLRERFLRVDCTDRDVRHDVRPLIDELIGFISRPAP